MGFPTDTFPNQDSGNYTQGKGPTQLPSQYTQGKGTGSPMNTSSTNYDNETQNQYNHNVGNYAPNLPVNSLQQGQQKQWYPGMYPSTQPQFGNNPYTPQTANIQGRPGHNPSTLANVEPNYNNSAYSSQGQFTQNMASGGTTNQPKMWAGSGSSAAPSSITPGQAFTGYTYNPTSGYYTNEAGKTFTPVYSGDFRNIGNLFHGMGSSVLNNKNQTPSWYMNPVIAGQTLKPNQKLRYDKKNMIPATLAETPQAPVVAPPVYQASYDQYAPTTPNMQPYDGNIDAAGLPLFNYGGLIPRR